MRVLLLVWGLYREKKPQADVVQKAGGWAGAAALGLQLGSEHLPVVRGDPGAHGACVPTLVLLPPRPLAPSVLKGCRHYRVRTAFRLVFFLSVLCNIPFGA